MRIGEVVNLRYDDICFKSNTIEIRAEVAKNRSSRYVPFSHKTGRLLKELRMEVEEMGTPYMFVTVYGNQLDKPRLRNRLKKYAESAGVTAKVSPHVLRHTFAKYYLLNNGDLMTLQRILGHSSLEMVRRYVQMTERDVSSQHAKFSPLQNLDI
jgi:integrase/recombinase XerD